MMTRFVPLVPRPIRAVGRRALLGLALLCMTASCSRFHRGDDVGDTATLEFVNQSLELANVYASVSAGESVRLGTVQPGRTEMLTVPRDLVNRGPVNILARLLAQSRVPQTGPVSISAGERLRVTLPADARTLTVLPGGS